MKNQYLIISAILLILTGCQPDGENANYDLVINNLNKSITSSTGRTASNPDIAILNLWVLDESTKEVLYNDSFKAGEIPDSLLIESLPESHYELYAHTAYDSDTDFRNIDTASFPLKIHPETYTQLKELYAGYHTFSLTENLQNESINMKNIGIKVNYRLVNYESLPEDYNINIFVQTNKLAYVFELDEYEYYPTQGGIGIPFQPNTEGMKWEIHQLPSTITGFGFRVKYPDMIQIDLKEPITLSRGDEITFTFDVEAILNDSKTQLFDFDDIVWNDVGEIVIN